MIPLVGKITRTIERARAAFGRSRTVVLVSFVLSLQALVGTYLLAEYLSENRARRILIEAVDASTAVLLDGIPVSNPDELLTLLKQIERVPAHHSSPTHAIGMELKSRDRTVKIVVARDSVRSDEFWVYRAGANWLHDPHGDYAGRITSSRLDAILRNQGL